MTVEMTEFRAIFSYGFYDKVDDNVDDIAEEIPVSDDS